MSLIQLTDQAGAARNLIADHVATCDDLRAVLAALAPSLPRLPALQGPAPAFDANAYAQSILGMGEALQTTRDAGDSPRWRDVAPADTTRVFIVRGAPSGRVYVTAYDVMALPREPDLDAEPDAPVEYDWEQDLVARATLDTLDALTEVPETEPRLYFAFGANIAQGKMLSRAPGAQRVGAAMLEGYAVGLRAGRLDIAPQEGASVTGMCWNVTARDERKLDMAEGLTSGRYVKHDVTLADGRGAFVYRLANAEPYGTPTAAYLLGWARGMAEIEHDAAIAAEAAAQAAQEPAESEVEA